MRRCRRGREDPNVHIQYVDITGAKRKWRRYSVRHSPTHTSNHHNTTPFSEPDHLPGHHLTRHHHTRDINFKHHIRIFRTIVQSRRLLLYPGRCNEAIHAPMLVPNLAHHLPQHLLVPHVNLAVQKRGAQFLRRAFLYAVKVRRWLGEAVQGVNGCAGFENGFALGQPQPSGTAGDEDHSIEEVELRHSLGGAQESGSAVALEVRLFYWRSTGSVAAWAARRLTLRRIMEVVGREQRPGKGIGAGLLGRLQKRYSREPRTRAGGD